MENSRLSLPQIAMFQTHISVKVILLVSFRVPRPSFGGRGGGGAEASGGDPDRPTENLQAYLTLPYLPYLLGLVQGKI